MTAFTPVDPANPQRETIYTQLKNAIINGDIAPDERIVETKYADIFRVSRTPVREAIRMLEREGLVVYEPRKGAVARPRLTRAEVDEVYTIRSALQLLSVDAVVRNITDAQLDAMEADNRGCAEALDKHDVGAYFRHLDEFNGLLTQSSNMPLLIKLLDQIESYSATTSFQNPEHARFRESVLSDDERRRRIPYGQSHSYGRLLLVDRCELYAVDTQTHRLCGGLVDAEDGCCREEQQGEDEDLFHCGVCFIVLHSFLSLDVEDVAQGGGAVAVVGAHVGEHTLRAVARLGQRRDGTPVHISVDGGTRQRYDRDDYGCGRRHRRYGHAPRIRCSVMQTQRGLAVVCMLCKGEHGGRGARFGCRTERVGIIM